MKLILLAATNAVSSKELSVEEITVPILLVGHLVVFVGFVLGIYFTLRSKVVFNQNQIDVLEIKLKEEIQSNKERIKEVKENHHEAYKQLDLKISLIEKEVSGISSGISKIEGYMKAMADKNS